MKPSLLRLLACPGCHAELRLRASRLQDGEIVEGALACRRCAREFQVVRGVARFVERAAYAASFGRQWHWFRTLQLDSASGSDESRRALLAASGWRPEDYRGRLVLDAGAGAGRFAELVAAHGGEVVGVDLTTAIDAAYANIGRRQNVHLVQADIFEMPFRPGSFDLAYSIGVLHHTPDPRAAFRRVAAMLKPGGQLAIFVYARYGPAIRCADALRSITTRLPLQLMLALSAAAGPLYYVYRLPALGKVLQVLCPISLHPRWRWRWLDTFDWYTPRYQWKLLYPEVYRWFREGGFEDVEIFDDPIRMRGVRRGAAPGDGAVLDADPASARAAEGAAAH